MNVLAPHLRWIVLIVVVYVLLLFTFFNETIFWYMYTFTMLLVMALSFVLVKMEDEVQAWEFLVFGIGYGTLTYELIATAYRFASIFTDDAGISVERFLSVYGPTTIWHYLLLLLVSPQEKNCFGVGYPTKIKGLYESLLCSIVGFIALRFVYVF